MEIVCNRDVVRKKYCSYSCRQKHLYSLGKFDMSKMIKPRGITHNWGKEYICRGCNEEKKDGHPLQYLCKQCAPSRKWAAIFQRYKIVKSEWDKMFQEQKGKCKLCSNKARVVDHNHKTGQVRGLLCDGCNLLVGLIERDLSWITRGLNYIKQ